MTSNMPIADAEELALWFIRNMGIGQRHALMSERPLLYARTFPGAKAETIIAHVRRALDNQGTATVPAGSAIERSRVRRGGDTGELMGWADRDTALVRFAGNDMVVEVPVSELRDARDPDMIDAEPEGPAPDEAPAAPAKKKMPPVRDPWI